MNFLWEPGAIVPAADVALEHAAIPAGQVLEGAPTVGFAVLGETDLGGHVVEVGVWESTPGVSTDIEVDEVFVVITGAARIDFIEPPRRAITVGPGDVVQLAAGMQTVWTVTETLRKVYVA